MALSFSDKDGYQIKGVSNSVSFTIANFLRFRDDKAVTPEDVGFKQLEEIVSFDEVETLNTESLEKTPLNATSNSPTIKTK